MNPSVIASIILIAAMLLFVLDKIPLALTSVLAILAMAFTGIMSLGDAFKGFSSNLVLLVAGVMIIGNALFENQVINRIGALIFGRRKYSEKGFLLAVMVLAAVLSGFLHNVSVMAMMMPLVASYVEKSRGEMKLKNFYMALSHATILGARFTLVGSSPPMLAQSVLLGTEGVERGFGFFELAKVAVPVFAVALLCYWLFLYRLGDRMFDHDAVPAVQASSEQTPEVPLWKSIVSGAVMVAVAVCFSLVKSIPLGAISLLGACVLMLTGCVNSKTAVKKLDWSTLIILGCATGIASCFSLTGLGDVLTGWLTRAGGTMRSPFLLVVIFTFVSALASNALSNSSITIIFATLAVSVAQGLGIDPIPLVAAVVFGGGCAFTLPTATSTLTMSNTAGYAFRDYVVVGTILSVICCASSSLFICLVYGLF